MSPRFGVEVARGKGKACDETLPKVRKVYDYYINIIIVEGMAERLISIVFMKLKYEVYV